MKEGIRKGGKAKERKRGSDGKRGRESKTEREESRMEGVLELCGSWYESYAGGGWRRRQKRWKKGVKIVSTTR